MTLRATIIPIGDQKSPELSPTATVGSIVTANPGTSRVFERYQIDYCCAGRVTLAEAAAKRNLNVSDVITSLRDAVRPPAADEPDWSSASMTALADHIERTHHDMLRRELPRLRAMTRKVAAAHAGNHPEVATIAEVFSGFADELEHHMMKEEQILFPALRRLEQSGVGSAGIVDGPIACMMAEHEDAGRAMESMRKLSHGYSPPQGACATYRAMLEGLAAIELDMHRHVHKENSILFPMAARRLGKDLVGA